MKTRLKNFTGLVALAMVFLLSACNAYQKPLRKGNNELAFNKAVSKLSKNPSHHKASIALEEAYNRLEKHDLRNIKNLKSEGNPANNVRLLNSYERLTERQLAVERFLPLFIEKEDRMAEIILVDYQRELVSVKKKAAEYLYVRSERLLETGSRQDARVAFEDLLELQELFPSFRETDRLLSQASQAGKSNVLVTIHNGSGQHLPRNLRNTLQRVALPNLQWANLTASTNGSERFDYEVSFVLDDFYVGPEMIRERVYRQEKEITVEVKKTNELNQIVRDSVTNKPVMVKKKKIIFADVTEVEQLKEGWIKGHLEIVDLSSGKIVFEEAVHSYENFENRFASANGNLDALNSKVRNLLDNRSLAFPSDQFIIENNINRVKPLVSDMVLDNRNLIL